MHYKSIYHPDIPKDLQNIPKNIKSRIKTAIEERLLVDPISYGLPLRKSLHGHRKLRVGDYRIIYKINNDEVYILKIGHRKEVYPKVLSRLV